MSKEKNKKESIEEEMIFDTSKLSKGIGEALEIAEAARPKEWYHPSFASQLFMGKFNSKMVFPFPEQPEEDKKIGDAFIEKLSNYLKQNIDPDEVDSSCTIPQKVIDELFKMGVFAMKIPKKYGGLGFSQVNYNRVMIMIASYCGGTAVMVSAHQSIGVPQPLMMFGTEEQKKKFLPRFREHAISAFALTESGAGSDPANMSTKAIPTADGKHYIINGLKLWCTNGPIAELIVVMAITPAKIVRGKEKKQITAFIIEVNSPGVEIVQRCDFMGLRGMQNGLIKFTNVKVPKENILLGEGRGLKLALATLNIGRLTLPAASVGMAKQCLSIVRRYGNKRIQWGRPIGRHEEGRKKISYIASTTFAMEAVTLLVSQYVDRKDIDIRIEAAMAKLFCSEAAWKIVDLSMQFCGGRGYEKAKSLKERGDDPISIERMMRDCRINTIIEGTSEIIKLFLAREAMDPHLKLAADLIKKRVPLGKKIKAVIKLLTFYSIWYPLRWLSLFTCLFHPSVGRKLSGHLRFAKKTINKLARTIFHCMAIYQNKLERKQILLGHLMEIGTELFTIFATCSYARMLSQKKPDDPGGHEELADLFCLQARRRIKDHFRAICKNDTKKINQLAETVLDGRMKWLEKGIIRIGPEE